MMTFLRSQSQTVLVVLLGFIALGFIFYGSSGTLLTEAGGHTTSDYGRIDGQDLSAAELISAISTTRASFLLQGRGEQLNQPGARAQIAQEAWRQLLLAREAARMHIVVTDQQMVDYIHSMPIFQKDGVYSPDVYLSRMSDLQNNFHISPDMFERVIRNNLRIDAVSSALFATVRTSAQDVTAQYDKFYGPETLSIISFDPKVLAASAEVKPEEIAAEYKAHPDSPAYRTSEKRKVDYIIFPLTPEQAKLPDKEKAAAIEALGQKALEFVLVFQPDPSATGAAKPAPDFMAEAKKAGLTPITTEFFTVDTPPANVPPSPSFNNAAFDLTKDEPISKVIEMGNGVAVLHLVEVQASTPRPFEEVKGGIAKQLQMMKGFQAAELAARTADDALKAAIAKGTDFKAAAAALNLKVETLPSLIPGKVAQTDVRLQTLAYASIPLAVGQISEPVPVQSDNSTVIVHLDSRGKADTAGLAEFETRYRQTQDQQLRTMAYIDWANWYNKRPGTHRPADLDAFGGVE